MSLDSLRKLTDVGLFVADLERAIAFYGGTLGFELKRLDIGFAEFRTDGVGLALWEVSDVTQALELAKTPRQGLTAMVAIRVETADEVDALHDALVAKGVRIVQAPTTHAWNARTTYFSDPDCNLWEIYAWVDAPRTI
ncbi:MAG: VOC family protein [Rhodospirillales bacterium]|nr:VOC family protein [Rhodospirillales bacterium]